MKNIDEHELIQKNKAVFLDRDGVINKILFDKVKFVNYPEDVYLLPGTADAIASFRKKGYMIFVVTNQAGVSLGYMSHTQLCDLNHNFAVSARLWFFLFAAKIWFQQTLFILLIKGVASWKWIYTTLRKLQHIKRQFLSAKELPFYNWLMLRAPSLI